MCYKTCWNEFSINQTYLMHSTIIPSLGEVRIYFPVVAEENALLIRISCYRILKQEVEYDEDK